MERQDDLDFDFWHGACNTFNQPDQKVLLCFDYWNNRQCHTLVFFVKPLIILLNLFLSFDGQTYQSAGSSQYSHRYTFGMANYRGKALTTGCWSLDGDCDLKTELMDMTTLTWSAGPDYPSQGGILE